MIPSISRALIRLTSLAALGTLAACAPAPLYKPTFNPVSAPPSVVATVPERYAKQVVIWGGRVASIRNLIDHSEITITSYPLDHSQIPQSKQTSNGQFIAVWTGFIDPLNFPTGSLITLLGQLNGSRAHVQGAATYVYPLVKVAQWHIWPSQ